MPELLTRIAEALSQPQLLLLATVTEDGKPWVRYVMGAAGPDLTIYVATSLNSRKVGQIRKNPEVHLTCGVADLRTAAFYLQIQGRAQVSTDRSLRHQLWNDGMLQYFKGPDDPNFSVIVIRPYRIEWMSMAAPAPEVWEA
jgi:general stress protein 26